MTALVLALGTFVVLWLALVGGLLLAGRRADAVAIARLIPDCSRLVRRLASHPAVPWRLRLRLWALLAYLAVPVDLVPDVLPVVGVLDDAILVALVLRSVIRRAGVALVRTLWPGPERTLAAVLRAARI